MRRLFLLVAAAASLCASAACTAVTDAPTGDEPVGASIEPIIGGTPATNYPEAATVNIDVPPNGGSYWACSAAVIAPRVVLTAGHCVDGHSKWEVYSGSQYRLSTSAVTYDWHENGAETVNPNHHDIGLIFLAADIVLASYPTLASAPVRAGTSVTNVGRIENGTFTSSLFEASGAVLDGAAYGYAFDYVATDIIQPGDSGGPDFVYGTHTIAAVNSGAGGGIEVLARVDLLSSWIAAQIAAHPGGAGGVGVDAGPRDGSAAAPDAKSDVMVDAKADALPPPEAATPTPHPDAGGSAPAPDAGGSAPAPDAGAAVEQEPNDTLAQANPIRGTALSGALSPAKDVDWFVLSAAVGTTTISLAATADAQLAAGVVSGAGCPLSVVAASQISVRASGQPAAVCLRVTTPGQKVQNYRIGLQH